MVHWITDRLGTAPWGQVDDASDLYCVDVRELRDDRGNPASAVKCKMEEALERLRQGKRVVVCCDYGISRSNAVAAGILAAHQAIGFDEAVRKVLEITGERAIKIDVLSIVRRALGQAEPPSKRRAEPARILVTGATGLIGSVLAHRLPVGYEVLAPARQEIDLDRDAVILDLSVKQLRIDTIIHLANPRIYTTNESMGPALVMLKNVLDVCVENHLFLVYLSCWGIYSGYKGREIKADETLEPKPDGTYGEIKWLCESLIQHYHQHQGINYLILRSGPVYGPQGDRPRFIWNFLQKALQDEDIITHKYEDGFPVLDLLHVDDLREAIMASLQYGAQGAINVGSGVGVTTTEVAERIVEITASRSKIRQLEIEGQASRIVMDIRRANDVLGWQPTIDLPRGLETLVRARRERVLSNSGPENMRR